MEIWIAKLLGPIIFALAIPMIFAPKSTNTVTRAFLEDKPLILISGILAMLAGLSIVNTYNAWKADWTIIITLFGWALTLGGASRIIMPHFVVNKVGNSMIENPTATRVAGIVWLAIGILLSLKAYS